MNILLGILLLYIIYKLYYYLNNYFNKPILNNTKCYEYLQFIEDKLLFKKNTIPKIIFRSAHFDKYNIHADVIKILNNLTDNNPEYIQIYFDDYDCYRFIKEKFPQYLQDYDSLIPTAYKSDLWRLLIIYYYGGIYNDIGHNYLIPINQIIKNNDELVLVWDNDKSYAIHNAMIAAYPQHPYIKMCIDTVIYNIRNKIYGTSVLDITSCKPMGRIFNKFFDRSEEDNLHIGIFKNKLGYMAKVFYLNANFRDPSKFVIEDINSYPVISTKFKNYYKIMYSQRGTPHYSKLWYKRQVYKF